MKFAKAKAVALAIVTALLASTTAMADLKEFESSGYWSASAGRSSNGTPMCLMSTSGQGRQVSVKWFVNNPNVYIHVFRDGWRIPNGAEMQFQVVIDTNGPFGGVATGLSNGNGIEAFFRGGSDILRRFLREFIEGNWMFLHFPSGNDPGWKLNLEGSDKVGRAFMRCINTYDAQYNGSGNSVPQPHRGGQIPQPHQGGQVPQPHQGGSGNTITPRRNPIPGERTI